MHHTPLRRQPPTGSFLKTVFMVVALVFVVVVILSLQRNGLPGPLSDMFTQQEAAIPGREFAVLDEPGKAAVMGVLSGFWRAELRSAELPGVREGHDGVEVKDNGIVWRVTHYTLQTAQGEQVYYQRTLDAYLRPFGWVKGKDSVMACDVRVLREAIIVGGDTCFSAGPVDVVWEVGMAGAVPSFGPALEYAAYDGDLHEFFPPDAVGMLERAYRGDARGGQGASYTIDRKNREVQRAPSEATLTLELPRCGPHHDPLGFARHALAPGSEDDSVPVESLRQLAGL